MGNSTHASKSHKIQCGAPPKGSDIGSQIIAGFESFNAQSSTVLWRSILVAVAINICLGLLTILAFSFLRPRNGIVYAPKVKYAPEKKKPPKLKPGFFDWVVPVLTFKEDFLVEKIGLDAALFLRFLRIIRNLFLVYAIFISAILIPINITQTLSNSSDDVSNNSPDIISIISVGFPYLWAHIAVAYFMTFYTLFILWKNYAEVVNLRWNYFRSEDYQRSLHARTLIVTHVPPKFQSDEGMATLISDFKLPYEPSGGQIGRHVGSLPELIEEHELCVRKLETHLASYLRKPDSLPSRRPTERVGGTCGTSVDAIDWYTARIGQLETEIEHAREKIDQNKATNYGFVSFPAVPYAHAVARRVIGRRKKAGVEVALAPLPDDIIWKNLEKSPSELRAARFIVGGIFLLFCVIYTFPMALISLFANLDTLSSVWPAFGDVISNDSFLYSLLSGYLAPVILSLLTAIVLPWFFKQLSKWQGAITKSQLERSVMSKMYLFQVINTLIILTLYTAIVKFATVLVCKLPSITSAHQFFAQVKRLGIVNHFSDSFVQASDFWISQTSLRGLTVLFDLAQLVALVFGFFRSTFFSSTPREMRDWSKPPTFEYSLYYSTHLFQMTVTLCYAIPAPLILPFSAFYFAISGVVYKYLLMYVFTTKIETGGFVWRHLFNRFIVALGMAHVILGLYVWSQSSWQNALSLLPIFLITIIFKYVCFKKFDDRFFYYVPDQTEHEQMIIHNLEAHNNPLQQRFGHYTLTKQLITPMVHARAKGLLAQIYKGRIDESDVVKRGHTIKRMTVGGGGHGLRFDAIPEDALELDPIDYRNEYMASRYNDFDGQSLSDVKSDRRSMYSNRTGPGLPAIPQDEYGHNYGQYEEGVNQPGAMPYPETNESRTRLLDAADYAGNEYSDVVPSVQQVPNDFNSGNVSRQSMNYQFNDMASMRSMSPVSRQHGMSPVPQRFGYPIQPPATGARKGTPGSSVGDPMTMDDLASIRSMTPVSRLHAMSPTPQHPGYGRPPQQFPTGPRQGTPGPSMGGPMVMGDAASIRSMTPVSRQHAMSPAPQYTGYGRPPHQSPTGPRQGTPGPIVARMGSPGPQNPRFGPPGPRYGSPAPRYPPGPQQETPRPGQMYSNIYQQPQGPPRQGYGQYPPNGSRPGTPSYTATSPRDRNEI